MRWLWLRAIISASFLVFVKGEACITPNGEAASCQPWYSCMVLLRALVNDEPSAKEFAETSKCGETPMVCCGSSGNFIPKRTPSNFRQDLNQSAAPPANDTKQEQIDFALRNLIPDKRYCGLQHTDDYVYNKTETALDEFPWLVYIPLQNVSSESIFRRVKGLRCTGFLISKQYVITERWCGSDKEIIDKVMVGQYHRDKSVSCFENPYYPECTEPLIKVKVTEILRPDVSSGYISNIKLLRLERRLDYSDFVRPICLPLDESQRAKIGDTVVTSGWGALNFNDSEGKIKKRSKHTLESIDLEGDGVTVLCGSPQDTRNTLCQGDNGGPLMYSYRNQWFAEGVISLDDGGISCDDPSELACAIRISPINIEWILLNMKP